MHRVNLTITCFSFAQKQIDNIGLSFYTFICVQELFFTEENIFYKNVLYIKECAKAFIFTFKNVERSPLIVFH